MAPDPTRVALREFLYARIEDVYQGHRSAYIASRVAMGATPELAAEMWEESRGAGMRNWQRTAARASTAAVSTAELRRRAAEYADHPDYDPAWAPEK